MILLSLPNNDYTWKRHFKMSLGSDKPDTNRIVSPCFVIYIKNCYICNLYRDLMFLFAYDICLYGHI